MRDLYEDRSLAGEMWEDCTFIGKCTVGIPLILAIYILVWIVGPVMLLLDYIEGLKQDGILFKADKHRHNR